MKPRLLIVFVVLLATPLGVAGWLGVKMAAEERAVLRMQFKGLLEEPLRAAGEDIRRVLQDYEREFIALGPLSQKSREELQAIARHSGLVKHCFVLDANHSLRYPPPGGPLDSLEAAFIEETRDLWSRREIAFTATEQPAPVSTGGKMQRSPSKQAPIEPSSKGWHTWHQGSRQHFLFWWRDETGTIVGAEVNWARFAADLIAALPHGEGGVMPLPQGCIALTNDRGERIYQWGGFQPSAEAASEAYYFLPHPLSAWRLEHFVPRTYSLEGLGQGTRFNLISGLSVLILGTLALGWYFHRETSRETREARQRVSFVNQVSHELKTPLTNIRMYAEMLEGQLAEEESVPRKYVHVIVSESQRLSRLIGNVLTFSRKERNALRLHPAEGCVDETVAEIAEQFRESLDRQGITLHFEPGAPAPCRFDPDAVQQVLANLLSNAEKYATGATVVNIATRQENGHIMVTVRDDGPGIPRRERERIFAPFYRVSNRSTDGVAGTGIGLAIARDLARRHGGDLVLDASASGATFVFSFTAGGPNREE